MSKDELLTPRQAAARLNRSPQTLAGWRVRGDGPAFQKYGQQVLYSEHVLDAWRQSQTRPVDFAPEPPPLRRKSLSPAVPASAGESPPPEQVEVGLLFGRRDALDGLAVLEPLNLTEVSVLDAVTRFRDIAIVARDDGSMTAYGIAGDERCAELVAAMPDGVLAVVGGRIVPLVMLADVRAPD